MKFILCRTTCEPIEYSFDNFLEICENIFVIPAVNLSLFSQITNSNPTTLYNRTIEKLSRAETVFTDLN